MGGMTDSAENDIMATIRGLIDEEHALRSAPGGLDPQERSRIKEVEEALDQCWDLLRQRRARSEFGQDPDEAEPRAVSEVENYRQ
jgi:hypothetical protein